MEDWILEVRSECNIARASAEAAPAVQPEKKAAPKPSEAESASGIRKMWESFRSIIGGTYRRQGETQIEKRGGCVGNKC
ncbi:MAG: hypothetical protein Q7T03_07760 [Deltaproteobacteria bacterium]|nr:hypothetical protein [Deltaproteobacteria bacterium]